ncbi:MAG: flagellar hook-basal body complex protein FliE [Candidatus Eremiobacteraeota bacterium]|nr:flagellar hook-basal body complex protein FliE [Candidatus Eremiobacteraeota bacterium]
MPQPKKSRPTDAGGFAKLLDDLGAALNRATGAENAYASGNGDLTRAVYERAQADVALSVATAAAQRTTQALQSVLNMQI